VEWTLDVDDGNRTVRYENGGVFHEIGDQSASLHWDNDTGRTVNVTLRKGNLSLCEIYFHAVPGKIREI
jgi:hypothetical protein